MIDPIQVDIETPDYTTGPPPPPPPRDRDPLFSTDQYTRYDDPDDPVQFSTLHAQLAPSKAQCYALKSRCWFNISISKIEDIEWAKEALDQLVLKNSVKSMLLGLVQRHKKDQNEVLSDLIPSKGKVRAVGNLISGPLLMNI